MFNGLDLLISILALAYITYDLHDIYEAGKEEE